MTDDRTSPFKLRLLDELWGELGSLEGAELDEYLADLDLAPDDLLRDYSRALSALSAPGARGKRKA